MMLEKGNTKEIALGEGFFPSAWLETWQLPATTLLYIQVVHKATSCIGSSAQKERIQIPKEDWTPTESAKNTEP